MQNNFSEFDTIKQRFEEIVVNVNIIEINVTKSKNEIKDMFEQESTRHLDDFKRFNDHQSKLEKELDHRFSQLDS